MSDNLTTGKSKLPRQGGPNSFSEAWRGLRKRKATINQRNMHIRDLKEKISSLESNLKEAEKELSIETRAHTSSIDALQREISELKEKLATSEKKIGKLVDKLKECREWHQQIVGDERVAGWLHQQDYSLYSLLAEGPINFEEALRTVGENHEKD